MNRDRRLEREITKRLEASTALDHQLVTVTAEHGRVHLVGSVQSFADRLLCGEVAEGLSGRGTVQNALHVRPFEVNQYPTGAGFVA